jgi:SAM-dependent methyltransferase
VSDVRYGDAEVARRFEADRYRYPVVLDRWCGLMAPWLEVGPGPRRVLDLGSGTGIWSAAIAERFDVAVVGVEPAPGMREVARSRPPHPLVAQVAGAAGALPLRGGSVTAAWLSTVVHQFPDLPASVAELRRVLVPRAPVVIRTFFPERHLDTDLYTAFPGARRLPVSGLTVDGLDAAFATGGFRRVVLDEVVEPREDDFEVTLARLPSLRTTDSALAGLTDDEWEAGLAEIRRRQAEGVRPAPFATDLVVYT